MFQPARCRSGALARTAAACTLVIALLGGAAHAYAAAPVVRTGTGKLVGAEDAGVRHFLGIPYAAPPVGVLRWRAPQPLSAWPGVRPATQIGAACIQHAAAERLPWTMEFMAAERTSEDCLFLNVWTAAPVRSHQAVMVFLHGGGFVEGSGAVPVYDGAALARRGVVVVTVNYRLGPLGFLAHPELSRESPRHISGNYALLDQIAALRWVQRNIAAFGGDPQRVTIFGQSAGAMSVATLMRSADAQGLFTRAIIESGPGLVPGAHFTEPLAQAEQDGRVFAQRLGATTLAQLRALPAAKLASWGPSAGDAPPHAFVEDGQLVGAAPPAHQVPVIIGMVAGDVALFGGNADSARVSLDVWAAQQLQYSPSVRTYYFDRAIPWPAHPEFGAFHSSELPYIFGTLRRLNRPWTAQDFTLSEQMARYWSDFAASGDPNGAGLPTWPGYDAQAHTTMQLGFQVGPMPEAAPQQLALLLSGAQRRAAH